MTFNIAVDQVWTTLKCLVGCCSWQCWNSNCGYRWWHLLIHTIFWSLEVAASSP